MAADAGGDAAPTDRKAPPTDGKVPPTDRKALPVGAHADPVVLFDGECAFCHAAVAFIRARDRRGRLRFVPLRSPAARPFLRHVSDVPISEGSVSDGPDSDVSGVSIGAEPETLYFYEHGRLYDRSTAALQIARYLGGLWPLVRLLTVIPRALRDPVYTFVARRRHRFRPPT